MDKKLLNGRDVRKALEHAKLLHPAYALHAPGKHDVLEVPLESAAAFLNLMVSVIAKLDKADDDSIVEFCRETPELALLKLYKYLNALGYRIGGIDQKIANEERLKPNIKA